MTEKAATPPTAGTGSGNIDLLGWDTVFALGLDAVNASIQSQATTPKTFDGKDDEGGASVSGSWNAWSVTGGEGNGILMKCPVEKGSLVPSEGADPIPLDGGWVEVMITLVAEDASEQLPDPTAKEGTGTTKHFKAHQTTDQLQKPRVQGVHFDKVTGDLVYAAHAAFGAYFEHNVGAFDAVFAAVRLEETALEKDKQWLKPAVSLYALATAGSSGQVAGAATSAPETAVGVLSLTKKPSGKLPQQSFDKQMFDVFGKTKTPTNSVFAVSAPLAMQHIVLTSAQLCVMGATVDDFHIVDDGITVANKNTLKWGNFKLKKDSPDTVVPVIQPGDFQLTLDGMDFHLSVSQAKFTTPDGSADVSLTADQYFNMGAVKLSDGHYYFAPDPGLGTNSIRADVTPNKGFEIAMIIDSIALGLALGFLGGSLGEALGDAVSGTVEGAEGVVDASAEDLENEINQLSEEEIEAAEDDAVLDATDSIESGGEDASGKTGLFANKWKVWGGVLAGMFGSPVGALPEIMQAIWNDKIHEGDVPTIDQFATNFTGAIQWPQVKGWQVTGGTFRAAFLLGGKAGH